MAKSLPYLEHLIQPFDDPYIHYYRRTDPNGRILICTGEIIAFNSSKWLLGQFWNLSQCSQEKVLELLCPLCQRIYLMKVLSE